MNISDFQAVINQARITGMSVRIQVRADCKPVYARPGHIVVRGNKVEVYGWPALGEYPIEDLHLTEAAEHPFTPGQIVERLAICADPTPD